MKRSELTIYHHRLPHRRLDDSVYFTTWRLAPGQASMHPSERELVQRALLHFHPHRYWLSAHVIMNDHVHTLLKPFSDHRLQDIVGSWKSYTGHALVKGSGRTSPVWQADYFDRIIRDHAEFEEKARYILNNPWKRWPDVDEYPWVGCNRPAPR